MTQHIQHITFGAFGSDLERVFDQLEEQPILVEKDGKLFRVEREDGTEAIWQHYDPEQARQALRQAQGLFAGTDREQSLKEMREQRSQGPNRFA